MTTARRIAQEMGVELGGTVGYHVRYDKCTSSSTAIKVAPMVVMVNSVIVLAIIVMFHACLNPPKRSSPMVSC